MGTTRQANRHHSLKMGATITIETSVKFYQTAKRNIPDDVLLQNHDKTQTLQNNSTVLFEKLTVTQLVKKFPVFMELEGLNYVHMRLLLICNAEPDLSSPHPDFCLTSIVAFYTISVKSRNSCNGRSHLTLTVALYKSNYGLGDRTTIFSYGAGISWAILR
jgi:hypothetical protein